MMTGKVGVARTKDRSSKYGWPWNGPRIALESKWRGRLAKVDGPQKSEGRRIDDDWTAIPKYWSQNARLGIWSKTP